MTPARKKNSHRRMAWWLCVSVYWLLSTAATAAPAQTAFPTFDNVEYLNPSVVTFTGQVPFTRCRVNDPELRHYQYMECGYMDVAETPGASAGRRIALFIGRLPALSQREEPDPLVLIDGGPGSAASETFILPGRGFDKVRQQRVVYLIDQRGTGKSARLDCTMPEVSLHQELEDVARHTGDCLAALSGDPTYYTTSVAVKDLDDVRRALGLEQWNLYGVSYGTRVAQHYLRQYPQSVRRVILDGVVPPQLNLGPDIALESERALQKLIARCAVDAVCHQQFGDLHEGVERLFRQLSETPQSVRPANRLAGDAEVIEFSAQHLMMVIRLALYNPATVAVLPLMLHEAYANNNFLPLARNAEAMVNQVTGALAYGMHNTVVCSEDLAFIDLDTVDWVSLKGSYLGSETFESMIEVCKNWPQGPVDPHFKEPVASSVPVLLLSGSADPITPPGYAEQARVNMPNSRHIIAEGFGHGIAPVGCMPRLMANFLSAQPVDDTCLAKQQPNPFYVDFNGPMP